MSECGIDGCAKPKYARNMCVQHWRRVRDRMQEEWHERHQPPIHGTRKRYEKGCRCDECVTRESEYRALWRLNTGRTKTSRVLGGQS